MILNMLYREDDDDMVDDEEEVNSEKEESENSSDSFSEFVDKKKDEGSKTEEQDLSKMTRRQKQAYLVKNNIIEVTEQSVNKKSGKLGLEDETVLYSLDPSRSGKPLRSEMPRRVRKHKVVTIEEQAEKQTAALKKILEEINRKEKERESKQKSLKKQKKDKEEEELREMKRRAKLNSVQIFSSVRPTALESRNKSEVKAINSVSFPKHYPLPEIFYQSVGPLVAKIEERSRLQK